MKRFSEFASEDQQFEGDKVRLDDVLNKEIAVLAYKIGKSKYEGKGDYMTIQIKEDEHTKVVFTGSEVLASQCKKYQEYLPFLTTIKKIDRYYTFT